MFSFGRKHELECATRHVRDRAQVELVTALINSIHDLLEGKSSVERVQSAVRSAFVEGKAGTWEQAGSWLRKLGVEHPTLLALWREFAAHPRSEVRFRAAAHLDVMPGAIGESLLPRLVGDKSARVRAMAIDRWSCPKEWQE